MMKVFFNMEKNLLDGFDKKDKINVQEKFY